MSTLPTSWAVRAYTRHKRNALGHFRFAPDAPLPTEESTLQLSPPSEFTIKLWPHGHIRQVSAAVLAPIQEQQLCRQEFHGGLRRSHTWLRPRFYRLALQRHPGSPQRKCPWNASKTEFPQ